MKRIETKEDLIQWATEINNGIGCMSMARKCDLQDIYGHSTNGDIDKAFIEAENERKLIICSVNNIMAFEEVERLLNVLARHKCLKQRAIDEEDFMQRETKLFEREQIFREAQKPIHKKIKELRALLEHEKAHAAILLERSERLREERDNITDQLKDFATKAGKYDAIKQLLA